MTPYYQSAGATLYHGDCLAVMRELPDASVDAVVTDPPYAEVDRKYGRLSVPAWEELMHAVVREVRRLLKPHGSAVFIIQPNSERIGKLRPWAFDFMSWCCREWNVVQDAYWWNITAPPTTHTQMRYGLMRPSTKLCVWIGDEDCYRGQDSILWSESEGNAATRATARCGRTVFPSGHSMDYVKMTQSAVDRGGVTPFNLLPIPNADSTHSAGAHGHGAGTPLPLCRWWCRYLTKPGGVVLDPFTGTGTVNRAARIEGLGSIGIERDEGYIETAAMLLSRQQPTLTEVAA